MKWLALAFAVAPAAAQLAEPATVITNLRIVGSASVVAAQSIVIVGDRIEHVGPATASPPDGARVVDGQGAFVIPGLWDMHVHLASYPEGLPLLDRLRRHRRARHGERFAD